MMIFFLLFDMALYLTLIFWEQHFNEIKPKETDSYLFSACIVLLLLI